MKTEKKPSVTLKHTGSLISDEVYRIERLTGTAKVCLIHNNKYLGRFWRVGNTLTNEVADYLCNEGQYDVIVLAP